MLRHCTTIVYESLIEITNNTGIVNTNVYNNKKNNPIPLSVHSRVHIQGFHQIRSSSLDKSGRIEHLYEFI